MFGWSFISCVTARREQGAGGCAERGRGARRWFAQTLRVLSRRMTSRTLPVLLCWRRRTSPVPLSFHSLASWSKRKSFARLRAAVSTRARREIGRGPHILNVASSSSSFVFVSTCSVSLITGSKCTSGSASSCCRARAARQRPLLIARRGAADRARRGPAGAGREGCAPCAARAGCRRGRTWRGRAGERRREEMWMASARTNAAGPKSVAHRVRNPGPPPQPPPRLRLPRRTTTLCARAERPRAMFALRMLPTMLALLLATLLPLVSAHIIHVGASTKDCFFEDLNHNDKVAVLGIAEVLHVLNTAADDRHVSSRRRRTARYRLLGAHATRFSPALFASDNLLPVNGPGRASTAQRHKEV
jgi:hypothetical protein